MLITRKTLKECKGDVDAFLLNCERLRHQEAIEAVQRRLAWIEDTECEDQGLRPWAIWHCQKDLQGLKGYCGSCRKRW